MLKNELAIMAGWVELGQPVGEALLDAEYHRIIGRWTAVLVSPVKTEVIRRYTSFQQQVLVELADRLYQVEPTGLLLERLLALADFQARYFAAYLNAEQKLPDVMLPALRAELTAAAGYLAATLRDVDADLRNCLLDYLATVNLMVNYRQINYARLFIATLETTMMQAKDVPAVLFYLNFNQPGFCDWAHQHVSSSIILPVRQDIAYDPAIPPVQQLAVQPAKMELTLTVAQLTLLLRLLYEEGVFATISIANLLRFFGRHFRTRKQEQISYGSMNKLYYSGDQFTGYAVRALLLKMVAKINRIYFPN